MGPSKLALFSIWGWLCKASGSVLEYLGVPKGPQETIFSQKTKQKGEGHKWLPASKNQQNRVKGGAPNPKSWSKPWTLVPTHFYILKACKLYKRAWRNERSGLNKFEYELRIASQMFSELLLQKAETGVDVCSLFVFPLSRIAFSVCFFIHSWCCLLQWSPALQQKDINRNFKGNRDWEKLLNKRRQQ